MAALPEAYRDSFKVIEGGIYPMMGYTDGADVSDAIKNAKTNNHLVKKIDDEKLVTKNKVGNDDHIVAIDKSGNVHSGKITQNVDGINDNVYKAYDPDDVVDMHTDPAINNQAKTQPQQCIDGKAFERNINNDPAHKGKVELASGINLTGFTKVDQVQIRLSNGKYTVVDNVWWKKVEDGNGIIKYEIVVNESKLSGTAPFTTNQVFFAEELSNGVTNFTLRSKKFEINGLPQNAQLEVKAYVKTVSNGNAGIGDYMVTPVN